MYCSNLYKILQISCLGAETFSQLVKFHAQKKEKLIVLAMVLAEFCLSKWCFLQRKCLIIKVNVIRCYQFYLVFNLWCKMLKNRGLISKFPRHCFPRKAWLYLFVCWFLFHFAEVTTCKNYLFFKVYAFSVDFFFLIM